MLTMFGKFCRKLRIDHGENMEDVANKLGVSTAFLSTVEHGKKSIPDELLAKMIDVYALDEKQTEEMIHAAFYSQPYIKIDLTHASPEDRKLAISFRDKFVTLTEQDKKTIAGILENVLLSTNDKTFKLKNRSQKVKER